METPPKKLKSRISLKNKKTIQKTNKQTHPKKTQMEKSNKNKKDKWNPVHVRNPRIATLDLFF